MNLVFLVSSFLVLALVSIGVSADVKLKVNKDSRRVIDLGTFGFGETGTASMTIKSFSLASNYLDDEGVVSPADEPIGFVIDKVTSSTTARVEKNYATKDGANERLCFIDDPLLTPEDGARLIFPLNGRKINDIRNGLPISFPVTVRGLYGIFFYNCRGFSTTPQGQKLPISQVSFDVNFRLYNTDPTTGAISYLPVGQGPLPYFNMLFFATFSILTVLWIREMAGNASHVKFIHRIMLFLVIVKALSLLLESGKQMHFKSSGTANILDVLYYVMLAIKGMTLFGILLLLGTGFSVLKSYLSDSDRKLMLLVLPCQLIINLLLAVIEETSEGNRSWQLYKDILQILDLACCCAVLLPLIWSMKNLREVSESSDKAAAAMQQMAVFRNFYIVILVYIYLTRVIVVVIEGFLPFDYVFVAVVIRELVAIGFYSYTGYRFRPFAQGVYSQLPTSNPDVEMGSRREVGHA